jgi:pantothenate synthetase
MLKRTYGRLLLTLLVISGLAGTLRNTSLSKKERKYATTLMKDTKSDLTQSLKGLTEAQLNFKPNAESWSVKECMYHIAISEKNLWGMLEGAMKTPATPDKRSEVKMTDEQVVAALESRERKVKNLCSF